MNLSRRSLLQMAAALAGGPVLARTGARLAPLAGQPSDYRALVCIFLQGGHDAANMLVATDTGPWGRYQSARTSGPSPIALAEPGTAAMPGGLPSLGAAALGGVLPITPRTAQANASGFALHPLMPKVQGLFGLGQAAVVANIGPLLQPVTRPQYEARAVPLPRNLFSHNDQTSTWQTGSGEGATLGWGGLLADLLVNLNRERVFTGISLAGNVPFLGGTSVRSYQVSQGGAVAIKALAAPNLFGSAAGPDILQAVVTGATLASPFQTAHAGVVRRSVSSQALLRDALATIQPAGDPPAHVDPWSGAQGVSSLARDLQTVANLIAAAPLLGLRRQVFFLGYGPFDYHQDANRGQHGLLAGLDTALDYFQRTLANLSGQDLRSSVITFTMSEFGRCFASNGSGTDHGWGGHHLVVGGAVKGGDIYGVYPTVGVDQGTWINPDALPMTGAWIPTTSVDQYAAPLAAWMGASPAQLAAIFPNLANFPAGPLGFL